MPTRADDGPATRDVVARNILLPAALAALRCGVAVVEAASGVVLASNAAWDALSTALGGGPARSLTALFPRGGDLLGATAGASAGARHAAMPGAVPPGGVTTWWDLELVPHPEAAGRLVATAREVTEQVLAAREAEATDAALSATGARLGVAQEATGIGLWELDLENDVQAWSPAQFRLFGLDPARDQPPRLDDYMQLVHPDDRSAVMAALRSGFSGGGGQRHLEFRLIGPHEGGERWLLLLGRTIVTSHDGRPRRLVGVSIDVTARRREQDALVASETRLRLAFQAAQMFAWDWDVRSGRVTWMGGLAKNVGLDEEGFGGTVDAFRALVHPDDSAAVEQALGDALSGRTPLYNAEFRMKRADGNWRTTSTQGLVLRAEDGTPLRVIGVDHDITEQRESEALLRESASRFAGMFDSMFQFVGLLSPDGRVLKANRAALEFAGVTREQVVGLAFWETPWFAKTPAAAEQVRRAVESAATGRFVRYEVELVGASRSAVIDFSIRPVCNADGAVILLVPEGRDISELKAAEAKLAANEARFRMLVDTLPLHTFTALPNGDNDFLNRRWFDYTGQTCEQALASGWAERLHPEDRERTLSAWRAARDGGTLYQVEHRFRGADGQYRWFLTRAVGVPESAPVAERRWIGGSVDITAMVEARESDVRRVDEMTARAEEACRNLENAARELESEIRLRVEIQTALSQARKLETMGQLTSSVAHDFNNVLAAIVGSYSLIRRRAPTQPVIEIVEHGERAADRARNLVRKLLAFARSEAPAPETLELRSALQELMDLVRHAAGEQVRCTLEVDPESWAVLADAQELGVALVNLAVNARDAMPEGGALRISARNLAPAEVPPQLPDGQYVSLSVRDEGIGMPPDVLARAQEAFFTTKPRGSGTGLGLPMVQDFAQRSGGTMRITSTPRFGTTVEIIIPRASLVASTSERLAALREISAPGFAAHGDASILLVEDDEQVRPLTAAFLRSLGYAVVAAPTAEAGRVLLHSLPRLDLLITDIALPGESGITLARRLRETHPGLPCLLMTGNQPPSDLDDLPVLVKPFRDTTLAIAILERLGREVKMDLTVAEPLLSRMADADMRALLIAWYRAKAAGEGFPHPSRIDPGAHGLQPHSFVAALEQSEPPVFHYHSVGKALLEELSRQSGGELLRPGADGEALFGTLDGVYRRCVRTAAPVYQSADYEFGDGLPFHFERLILPASEDGETISHLFGVVLFGDREQHKAG